MWQEPNAALGTFSAASAEPTNAARRREYGTMPDTGDVGRCRHSDHGMALPTVILTVIVFTALTAALMTSTLSQVGSSGFTRDREGALHAADSGAQLALSAVSQNSAYVSTRPDGTPHQIPAGLSDADQRLWAIHQYVAARDVPTRPGVHQVPNGLVYALRPMLASSASPAEFVLGVGEVGVPGRGRMRVVRMNVGAGGSGAAVPRAVTTDGYLYVKNSKVSAGGVHSNTALDIEYSTVWGATTTGTRWSAGSSVTPGHDLDGSSRPALQLPALKAQDLYRAGPPAGVPWFDLCESGGRITYHNWSPNGPCDPAAVTGTRQPWTWNVQYRKFECYNGTALYRAIYYAHHASIKLYDSVADEVVLIASRDPAQSNTAIAIDQGNVFLQNSSVRTPLPGYSTAIFADRDIGIYDSGVGMSRSDLSPSGPPILTVAGEQLEFGSSKINGAGVALDAKSWPGAPTNLATSHVASNGIVGSSVVTYDGSLTFPGAAQAAGWKELLP